MSNMANPPKQDPAQTVKVASVVSFYMSAALVMVFVNKAVLTSTPSLPLLFLLNQLLIAVALLHLGALLSPRIDVPKLDWQTARSLGPVVVVNVVGLVFNTLCLRDVEASFFQIARGLQLPLTILVSSLATRSSPSNTIIASATLVSLGFILGVSPSLPSPTSSPSSPTETPTPPPDPAHTPSALSLLYGLLSSLMIALHAVLIKSSLPAVQNSTIHLAYYTNLGSALLLLPLVILDGEILSLFTPDVFGEGGASVFVWGSVITGVFGFLLCVAGLLSIKVTSPVTHMFSSAARSVIQTVLGVWIFGDLLTANRAASILVILGGTMWYTYIKSLPPPPAPSSAIKQGQEDVEMGMRGDGKETLFALMEEDEEGEGEGEKGDLGVGGRR